MADKQTSQPSSLKGANYNQINLKHFLIWVGATAVITFFGIALNITTEGVESIRGIFAASGFMVLFGIWFGIWGILASGIGGFLANLWLGYAPIESFLISIGDLLMSAIPALAFRYTKSNNSLEKANDWVVFILFGALIPTMISALISVEILFFVNILSIGQFWPAVLFWFTGSLITVCLITPIFLLMFSNSLERAGLIVRNLLN
ncbi:MAG: MASE1 domain-containing protein [Candidatus Ranarchaeia archaeon]